jgi:hypothetical protein
MELRLPAGKKLFVESAGNKLRIRRGSSGTYPTRRGGGSGEEVPCAIEEEVTVSDASSNSTQGEGEAVLVFNTRTRSWRSEWFPVNPLKRTRSAVAAVDSSSSSNGVVADTTNDASIEYRDFHVVVATRAGESREYHRDGMSGGGGVACSLPAFFPWVFSMELLPVGTFKTEEAGGAGGHGAGVDPASELVFPGIYTDRPTPRRLS